MREKVRVVDLCGESSSLVQSAAFYAVKEIAPGDAVVLVTARDPALMMSSLDLQLRHNLAWSVTEADGRWRIEVRRRDDAVPRDVLEVLERDHRRLDGLFVRALRLLNRNDHAAAAPLLREFAVALRRHIRAEDEILAPALGPAGAEPLVIMLREHGEILGQLAVIEDCLAADQPEAGETAAFTAILSGTLAKHEHREEGNLFPLWRVRLAQLPETQRRQLMMRVESLLQAAVNGEG